MKALDIANAIIMSQADNSYLTNMKLNKLVYFAYAEALQVGKKIFSDNIEAWTYGPVIPSVYRVYASRGSNCIKSIIGEAPSDAACQIAKQVWSKYGFMTAMDIMRFSHRDTGAWKSVFTPGVSHISITDNDILKSADGKDSPSREGTFSEAMDESSKRWSTVLEMLSNS